MSIGFSLSGPDNGSRMLSKASLVQRCHACGLLTSRTWIDAEYVLPNRRLDISSTYDNYLVVSGAFRDVLGVSNGVSYIKLPAAPDFYVLNVSLAVPFDVERRKTRFEGPQCGVCGRFPVVAGATPAFVKIDELPAPVVRTDVEFGTNDEQSPLVVVAPDVAAKLRSADLAGLDLEAVFGPDDGPTGRVR